MPRTFKQVRCWLGQSVSYGARRRGQAFTEDNMHRGSGNFLESAGQKATRSGLPVPDVAVFSLKCFVRAKQRGGRFGRISPVPGRSLPMLEKRKTLEECEKGAPFPPMTV